MPSALPDGDPAPADGALPDSAWKGISDRSFGVYLHVPFCVTRCGYCDFNTYTADELGPGAARTDYADTVVRELQLAGEVLGHSGTSRSVQTVFVGGGTPTLLPPADLVRMLAAVREQFGLADGAEVTTEANPESVDPAGLSRLRDGGFTRISFGMQSAIPHVLATLDRRHTPGRVAEAVQAARQAGFEDISVDLIYGTPGESAQDWQVSLDTAIGLEPTHVSAYALIVEDGTPLARKVRRGELPAPDDDDLADKYEQADEALTAAGYPWYEVSNWGRPCRHNLAYWRGDDWWGAGPGAHSHVGGVRWWNVKHPASYAARLAEGVSPAAGRELLDPEQQHDERVLLGIRLAEGFPLSDLSPAAQIEAKRQQDTGRVIISGDRLVLTRTGRLLADAVVRELLAA
jgi:putative oxygen-independent coproporphyrinogen III oxidase